MNFLTSKNSVATAHQIWFTDNKMHVLLHDGRELGVPLEWFPKLRDCTESERQNWRLIGNGIGIHWEDLDEDLSIDALLF